jgi:hypothetical protein
MNSVLMTSIPGSISITYQLCFPKDWAGDVKLRMTSGVSEEIAFATKLDIALGQIYP